MDLAARGAFGMEREEGECTQVVGGIIFCDGVEQERGVWINSDSWETYG